MVFRYYMRTSGSPVSTVISGLTSETAMELLFPSLLLSYILSFIPPLCTSTCQLAVLLSTVKVILVQYWPGLLPTSWLSACLPSPYRTAMMLLSL